MSSRSVYYGLLLALTPFLGCTKFARVSMPRFFDDCKFTSMDKNINIKLKKEKLMAKCTDYSYSDLDISCVGSDWELLASSVLNDSQIADIQVYQLIELKTPRFFMLVKNRSTVNFCASLNRSNVDSFSVLVRPGFSQNGFVVFQTKLEKYLVSQDADNAVF